MTKAAPDNDSDGRHADLRAKVLREVSPALRKSVSPLISDEEAKAGVESLFQLLAHHVGDPELDAVGEEIIEGLRRWFDDHKLVKLGDRYEPFCKFLLRTINPTKYAKAQTNANNRLAAAAILKALGLVTNKTLEDFVNCPWDKFPPPKVGGSPNFLEHVARTYLFRNVDAHQARVLNTRQEAEIVESICVFLVSSVIKYRPQIERALRSARFSAYLAHVREQYAEIGPRFLELKTEPRSSKEFQILDPLSSSQEDSHEEKLDASKLAEGYRVTVIEAEPGAGKTTTLQFITWQQARGVLDADPAYHHIPVYIELKVLSHGGETIETAVKHALKLNSGEPTPWDSILLLVDGMNEVGLQSQSNFKTELRGLLSCNSTLRAVIAGRPNSFHGEFEARIVVLQTLSEAQRADFFRRTLGDDSAARQLGAIVRSNLFLSSWTRTPLHAAMVVRLAKQGGVGALNNHSMAIRKCVHSFLKREEVQAPGQTSRETKERLLGRLAFDTKCAEELTFTTDTAIISLKEAKGQMVAASLDLPKFLQESIDNHLLQRRLDTLKHGQHMAD